MEKVAVNEADKPLEPDCALRFPALALHHLQLMTWICSSAGLEVLTSMEKVAVDEDDRPLEPITITGATVFVNPYKDEEAAEKKAAEDARLKVRIAASCILCLPDTLCCLGNTHCFDWPLLQHMDA